jgi:hypothetical protein
MTIRRDGNTLGAFAFADNKTSINVTSLCVGIQRVLTEGSPYVR